MFLIRRLLSKRANSREPQLELQRHETQKSWTTKELLCKQVAEADTLEKRVALWTSIARKAHQDVIVELPDSEHPSEPAIVRSKSFQSPEIADEYNIEADSESLRNQNRASSGTNATVVVWNGDQHTSESSDTQVSEFESGSAAYRSDVVYSTENVSAEYSHGIETHSDWLSFSDGERDSESEATSSSSTSRSQLGALRSLEHAFGLPESESNSDLKSESEASSLDSEASYSGQTSLLSSNSEIEVTESDSESDSEVSGLRFCYLNTKTDPWESSIMGTLSDDEPEEQGATSSSLKGTQGSQFMGHSMDSEGTDSIENEPAKTPKHIGIHKESGLLMELSQEGRHKRFWHDEFSEENDEQGFNQLFGRSAQRQGALKSRKF